MKKVNDELDETEVQVEIVGADSLMAIDCKSIQSHITNKDGKELSEYNWNPKNLGDSDLSKATMTIPD